MPDLVAQGNAPEQKWRFPIPNDRPLTVGREVAVAEGLNLSTTWDSSISRQHVEVRAHGETLHIRKLETARNPLYFRGRDLDEFSLQLGEHFVIGDTSFLWAPSGAEVAERPGPEVTEQTFSYAELKRAKFRDADQRIDALSRLPEMLAGVVGDNELYVRLLNVMLSAVPHSSEVAIVAAGASIEVLHWEQRRIDGSSFSASERLIRKAADTGESIVHIWESQRRESSFTEQDNVDWAYCVPLRSEACPGWALYVAGQVSDAAVISDPRALRDDIKFTELCASTLRHHFETRLLERRQSSLRPFFSPVVLEALAGRDPEELLEPRESNVTVLFCDLRGFSRSSEQSAHDLLGLLQRVSQALGIMTHHILAEGGVVGDFHGDAAMGFWGWPIPSDDDVLHASRAALAIRDAFETARNEDDRLTGFKAGIGMATGRAVAGGIGTVDQIKVTVFGPVVNLASRLEGLTRQLHASVLIDQKTAEYVRANVSHDIARVRRVARVRPFGMEQAEDVHELLPSFDRDNTLRDSDIEMYEKAVECLTNGEWEDAFQMLHHVR